jgi:hypothetical protein
LQLLRELLACGLVGGIGLVSERQPRVVYPAEVLRPVSLQQAVEKIDDSPCGRRVLAPTRRKWSRN